MKKNNEFDNFDRTMRDLMSVPHDEIKAALDAEKAAKKRRPKYNRKALNDKRNQNANRTE